MSTNKKHVQLNPLYIIVSLLVLIALSMTVINAYMNKNNTPDFSWNTSQRSLSILGVDSSGLRLNAGYNIDTNLYNPTYTKQGITISTRFNPLKETALTPDEEDNTIKNISRLVPEGTAITDDSLAFLQKGKETTRIPVKVAIYQNPTTHSYEAIVYRVFNNESASLITQVTSKTESSTKDGLNDVLNNLKLTESESSY